MLPHQSPLPKPQQLQTPKFEQMLEKVKFDVLEYLTQSAPHLVNDVAETLENEAELITKFTEAFVVILQNYDRKKNADALQMFAMYATDTEMVDLIASQLGVKRQVISPGDPDAYPAIPPVMESNEQLLTRYFLAAYALSSTGTRAGYRYHAMTLGGRPKITVSSPEPKTVVVTYKYQDDDFGSLTKDAQARKVAPGTVDCFILSHEGDGIPSAELLSATSEYMNRDDVAQETDSLSVKPAVIKPWSCNAVLYIKNNPDSELIKNNAEQNVISYANEQHRLGGRIDPSMLYSKLLSSSGAIRADLIEPMEPVSCEYSEAPYLENINITVETE